MRHKLLLVLLSIYFQMETPLAQNKRTGVGKKKPAVYYRSEDNPAIMVQNSKRGGRVGNQARPPPSAPAITPDCAQYGDGMHAYPGPVCDAYFECDNGELSWHTCDKRNWFDPEVGECVPGACSYDNEENPFCHWNPSYYTEKTCDTYIACRKRKSGTAENKKDVYLMIIEECPEGLLYNSNKYGKSRPCGLRRGCFDTIVNATQRPPERPPPEHHEEPEVACSGYRGKAPFNAHICDAYLSCANDDSLSDHTCPPGYFYHNRISDCVPGTCMWDDEKTPKCTADNSFSSADKCHKFKACYYFQTANEEDWTAMKYVVTEETCPYGNYYNGEKFGRPCGPVPITQCKTNPWSTNFPVTPRPPPPIPAEKGNCDDLEPGNYPYPGKICDAYFICNTAKEISYHTCPENHWFDSKVAACVVGKCHYDNPLKPRCDGQTSVFPAEECKMYNSCVKRLVDGEEVYVIIEVKCDGGLINAGNKTVSNQVCVDDKTCTYVPGDPEDANSTIPVPRPDPDPPAQKLRCTYPGKSPYPGHVCDAYTECSDTLLISYHTCPEQQWFDFRVNECKPGNCQFDNEVSPNCTEPNKMTPHRKCDWYYVCLYHLTINEPVERHVYTIVEEPCPEGTHYDSGGSKCVEGFCGVKPTTKRPTTKPTTRPTTKLTTRPTTVPPRTTPAPTTKPTPAPTTMPTTRPTTRPMPTTRPTTMPTTRPTTMSTMRPTTKMTTKMTTKAVATTEPPNWEYYFSDDKATKDDAKQKCEAMQAKLLVLFTGTDNKHVADLYKAHDPQYPEGTLFWSGAIQRGEEAYFEEPQEKQIDAYDYDVVDWDGAHDTALDGCVAFEYPPETSASVWRRLDCSSEINYICIKDTKLAELAAEEG